MTLKTLTNSTRAREVGVEQHILDTAKRWHRVVQRAVDQKAAPVRAEVNHGRWIAPCPDCNGGAEMVDPTAPIFFCMNCGNRAIGGAYRRVEFPPSAVVADIEELLSDRPEQHKNWVPGEDQATLVAENVAHGVRG
uniref:Uncharacterized protein n=1 Tax=viral metagenome TaxID=1070528 RepID=A0A6M3KLR5_9ZZZZ